MAHEAVLEEVREALKKLVKQGTDPAGARALDLVVDAFFVDEVAKYDPEELAQRLDSPLALVEAFEAYVQQLRWEKQVCFRTDAQA